MPGIDGLQGRTLGDFVLKEKLGEGQFGSVYRAEQPMLEREAVVKILHERHRTSETNIRRFLREAWLAAQLDHPYAAHIYTYGAEVDGLLWIAMERVRGTPLQQLLSLSGPLPLERFVPLAEKLCEVLETAHEQRIVHRDVKPGNIIVTSRGGRLWPKLLDFGVAKLLVHDDGEAGDAATVEEEVALVEARLTDTRARLGSPAYLAPELWRRSSDADARSDLYALGITAFESLTGRLPFCGDSLLALARAHASAPLPTLDGRIPPAVHAVLARATAKQPAERHASVAEFARDLRAAAGFDRPFVSVPWLDETLRPTWLLGAPQPLAEAVAALEAAGTPQQEYEAVARLVRVVAHWLGIVALACRAKDLGHDATMARWLRVLGQRVLGDEEWLELGRDACRRFAGRPEAFPLPELIALFCPGDASPSFADQLMRLRTEALCAAAAPADEARARGEALRSGLTTALARLAFVTEFELVVARRGRAERWMGVRRLPRPTVPLGGDGLDGEPLLTTHDGDVIARLSPLVQVAPPTPGAAEELFFLEGAGRSGGKLVALPTGFERHDVLVWDWLRTWSEANVSDGDADADDRPPYCGLAAFTSADADRFFGRENEALALVNRLRVQPLVLVVGASGAGKSSLVQAGLIPALGERYGAVVARPGLAPVTTLLARLRAERWLAEDAPADAESLAAALCACAAERGQTLLVVIDQFEELFTSGVPPAEQQRYAALLAALARSADAPLRVVLTVRDDFLGRTQALQELRPHLPSGLQLCATPSPAELLRIIREPARRRGYGFSPEELPLEVVQAVAHEPGALALVSFTATRMWELRDRHRRLLTKSAYDALGGVGGALSRHAEETLAALPPTEARLVREAFRHLATADGMRAVLRRDELVQLMGGGAAATTTIERLLVTRLLVSVEGPDGNEQIEIVHEALLSAWPQLVDWRREDAEGARLRDQLRTAARQWAERSRSRGLLWRNDALVALRLWRARHGFMLTETERAFADASLREAARARLVRIGAAVVAFVLLTVSVAVARERARQAQHRLGEQYEEEGRRAFLEGKTARALAYLQEAAQLGVDDPARRFLFAAAAAAARAPRGVLGGHTDAVRSLSFSPDGARLLTSSSDKTVRVWDVASGQATTTMVEPAGLIRAVFSPDGTMVATAGESRDSAQLFDARSGALVARLGGHGGWVNWVDFRADGARVVTACEDHIARIFDARSGALVRELRGHGDNVRFAAFSPDGAQVLTGSLDETARLWDSESGRVRAALRSETGVLVGAFSADGARFAFGDFLGNVYVGRTRDGALLHHLDGHTGRVRTIAFSADSSLVHSASDDGSLRIWDAGSGRLVTVLRHETGSLRASAFAPDGRRIVTAGHDSTARLWDVSGALHAVLEGHLASVSAVAYSPDGALVATASVDGAVRLWQAGEGRPPFTLRNGAEPISARLARDDGKLIAGYTDGRVVAYDAETGKRRFEVAAQSRGVTVIALSPDERRLLTAGGEGTAHLYDAHTGAFLAELRGHEGRIESIIFSRDGARIGTVGDDGTARVWSADRGQPELILRGHSTALTGIDFSPDGRRILTASADRSTRIWDARSGAAGRTVYRSSMPMSVHFSCDGSRIIVADNNGTATVEDADSGAPIGSLIGHLGQLTEAIWSPQCELIATAGRDGTVRLWDAQTFRLLQVHTLGKRPVNDVAFDRRGTRLVAVGGDDAVHVFALPQWDERPGAASALARCRAPFRFTDGKLVAASPDLQACAALGFR